MPGVDLEQFLIKAYDLRFGVRSIQHEVGRQVVSKLAAAHEEDVIGEGDTVILSVADNEVCTLFGCVFASFKPPPPFKSKHIS